MRPEQNDIVEVVGRLMCKTEDSDLPHPLVGCYLQPPTKRLLQSGLQPSERAVEVRVPGLAVLQLFSRCWVSLSPWKTFFDSSKAFSRANDDAAAHLVSERLAAEHGSIPAVREPDDLSWSWRTRTYRSRSTPIARHGGIPPAGSRARSSCPRAIRAPLRMPSAE